MGINLPGAVLLCPSRRALRQHVRFDCAMSGAKPEATRRRHLRRPCIALASSPPRTLIIGLLLRFTPAPDLLFAPACGKQGTPARALRQTPGRPSEYQTAWPNP